MGKFESKLAEMGVTLPEAAAPAANYVPYVQVGDILYVSGQLPKLGDSMMVGKLGDDMDVAQGAEAAISGPGRGYEVDPGVTDYLLVGDESAIPAISQLLETIGSSATIRVHLEVDDEFGKIDLPDHPGRQLSWHTLGDLERGSRMVTALSAEQIDPDTTIWCAGQAAAMQQVRNHLFKERGVARAQATVRGYWK